MKTMEAKGKSKPKGKRESLGSKSTLPANAYADVIAAPTPKGEGAAAPARPKAVGRINYVVRFPYELLERLRDAAYWSRDSINGMVERAVANEIERLEKAQGAKFLPRDGEIKPGRKIGADR